MSDLFTTGVRPIIDDYLLEESKKVRDYGDYWSASSGGYCMRRVIFERLGVPKVASDGDARKTRVFESGKIFHEWIQGITKKAGLSIAQELELQDEDLMIRGHIDDLVLIVGGEDEAQTHGGDLDGGESYQILRPDKLILYDYKTQNSRAFSYKRPDMSHYHKMQLGTYMYMLRTGVANEQLANDTHNPMNLLFEDTDYTKKHVAEARILKISKDDLRMSEEQLLWSAELESEVISYWTKLNDYWNEKKLPKCTCADYEGGFLAGEKWNGYFWEGEPCSIAWYDKCKKEGLLRGNQ